MSFAPELSAWLLQAAALQDTVVAKVTPPHGLFYYTSNTLQLIVLVLGIIVLVVLALVLLAVKRTVEGVKSTVDKLYADTKPVITKATGVADDAREVVTKLRGDLERVTHAAGTLSHRLLDAADVTGRRVDDVNAVLDVVQGEIEETVLSTTAALRGVRVGSRAIAGAIGGRKKVRRAAARRDETDELYDDEEPASRPGDAARYGADGLRRRRDLVD